MIPLLDLLGPDLSYWVAQFMLTVARLSFVIILMPGIGEQMIPAQVRVYLLLGLSAAISGLGITDYTLPESLTDLGIVIVMELLLGLFLGIGLRVVIWSLNIAGSIIAQSMGLAQPLGVALVQLEGQPVALALAGPDAQDKTVAHVEPADRVGDMLQHTLDADHALRAAEAAEGGVGAGVGAPAVGDHLHGRDRVGVVGVEHRPVADGPAEVERPTAPCVLDEAHTGEAAVIVKARLVLDDKVVAFAADDGVIVPVEAAFDGAAKRF